MLWEELKMEDSQMDIDDIIFDEMDKRESER